MEIHCVSVHKQIHLTHKNYQREYPRKPNTLCMHVRDEKNTSSQLSIGFIGHKLFNDTTGHKIVQSQQIHEPKNMWIVENYEDISLIFNKWSGDRWRQPVINMFS